MLTKVIPTVLYNPWGGEGEGLTLDWCLPMAACTGKVQTHSQWQQLLKVGKWFTLCIGYTSRRRSIRDLQYRDCKSRIDRHRDV